MSTIPLVALSVRPTATPQDLQAQQMQLKNLAGQNAMIPGQLQEQQQSIQSGANTLQLQQQQLKDTQALTKAWQQWDGKDPTALPKLVVQNGGSGAAAQQAVQHIIDYQTKSAALTKDQLDNQQKEQDEYRGRVLSIINAPKNQQQSLWDAEITKEENAGTIQPGQMSHTYPGDDAATAIANHFALGSVLTKETNDALQAKARASQAQTSAERLQAELPGGALASPERAEMQDYIAKHPGQGPADFAKWKASLAPQAQIGAQGGILNQQAKDMAAENYFQTGQLPSGMRSPAMAGAIISRAAELHPNATTELAGNRAAFEANKKSYDNVTDTLDTLSAFEASANKNMDQFLNLTKKLPDSVPWLNTPLRNLDQNMVGAEWMPAINAARSVMDREIARVTNDPKLTGALTDSARAEVSGINPANATLPQIVHLTQTLRNDMTNVHTSLAQQKQDIGTRLGIKPTSTQAGGAQGGGPAQGGAPSNSGTTRIKASDGSLHDIPTANLDKARQIDPKLQVIQ